MENLLFHKTNTDKLSKPMFSELKKVKACNKVRSTSSVEKKNLL
jgi:hypothetical protein